MHLRPILALALPLLSGATAKAESNSTSGPDEDGKYWIRGNDISAAFIPYGAAISNLLIKDKNGVTRDIVAGFDNATHYSLDEVHPHFGSVPGRYANRIKNSTFEIDGEEYHTPANENPTEEHPDGVDTLHGGPNGWDYRNFTVVAHTESSITFSLVDPDGEQGFPGEVVSLVTYTLRSNTWEISMVAVPTTKATPIMLSSHTYWNLDGFANDEVAHALNHTVHMPFSNKRVGVDSILIPTGEILDNEEGSVNDFWSEERQVGKGFADPDINGNCGAGCTGYDNCYILSREEGDRQNWTSSYVARVASPWSGISLEIYTDQDAFQLYSCTQQDGSLPLKKSQGLFNEPEFPRVIPPYGCVVLEVQDWIDGINHPEWGREDRQIFRPGGDPYILRASYVFSVDGSDEGGDDGNNEGDYE